MNTLIFRAVLTAGMDDWEPHGSINAKARIIYPSHPADQHFAEAISVVRALAEEGLVQLGNTPRVGTQFMAWDGTLDEQISRIEQAYEDSHGDQNWEYYCWLNLTELGQRKADEVTPEQRAEYEDRFYDWASARLLDSSRTRYR